MTKNNEVVFQMMKKQTTTALHSYGVFFSLFSGEN